MASPPPPLLIVSPTSEANPFLSIIRKQTDF